LYYDSINNIEIMMICTRSIDMMAMIRGDDYDGGGGGVGVIGMPH